MWTRSGEAVGEKVEKQLEKKIAEKKGEIAGRKKPATQGMTKQQRQKMTRSGGDSKPRRVNRRFAKRAGIDTLRKDLDRLQQGRKVAQQAGRVLTVARVVASGVEQDATSTAQTQAGKIADTVTATVLHAPGAARQPAATPRITEEDTSWYRAPCTSRREQPGWPQGDIAGRALAPPARQHTRGGRRPRAYTSVIGQAYNTTEARITTQ